MKLKKILAALSASAVAATMCLSASASMAGQETAGGVGLGDDGKFWVRLVESNDDGEKLGAFDEISEIKDVKGIKFTFTVDDDMEKAIRSRVDDGGEEWMNLGLCVNSESTGWLTITEISAKEGDKDFFFSPTGNDKEYSFTFEQDEAIFAETDTYAKIALEDWSSVTGVFTVTKVELIGAKLPGQTDTPKDDSSKDDTSKDDTSKDDTSKGTDNSGQTGLAGIAMVTVALAGASVVATKKRK